MLFNVAQLLKSPVGATRGYEVDDRLPTIEDNPATEPVRGRVKLLRTSRGILVEADLTTATKLQCSRCLEDAIVPLSLRIEEEFLPTIDVNTGFPVPTPPDEASGAFQIDDHHQIDLGEAVRQYGLIAMPLQPLCREDCAGLCPTCGENRNSGACECQTESIDARLAAFRRLLNESGEAGGGHPAGDVGR